MIRMFILAVMVATVVGVGGISPAKTTEGSASDRFEIRGLKGLFWDGIEKYYKAVPWMAAHDMNFLMLCYTAYPESGKDWRKDYTDEHLAEMKELVTRAEDEGITICLSFNPGIWSRPPLCHSCEDDYQASWRKVKDAHAIGITWIALCLDDITKEILPADKDRFGTLEAAQVEYVNRLWADMKTLEPRPHLIFCPSAYTTGEMEKHLDYIKVIGNEIDPEIDLFWTGPEVCSPSIAVADCQEVEKLLKRQPFIWDNYPVNDMFPWRPLLAPVKGRDAKLAGAISGILFNPMKQWELNRIPLVSVADYLNDPVNYDPAASAEKAVAEFPEKDQPVIRLLQKHYGSSFIGDRGYPPGVMLESLPDAKTVVNDLTKLRGLMTAPESSLGQMWLEIKDTVEADLNQAAILSEGPFVSGTEFQGGAPKLSERAFGGKTGLVYARATGKAETSATLWLKDWTKQANTLRLMCRNSDSMKPQTKILLNGKELVRGIVEAPQDRFAAVEIPIPPGTLQSGPNYLVISNEEAVGTEGVPPWFAVKWAQVIP